MMPSRWTMGLICLLPFAFASPAAAQGMGLDGLHEKVRIGGKLCMADHFHQGASNGMASRKAAEIAAIKSWQDFTAWEYGSAWGSWAASVSRSMNCGPSGGSWGCTINSRPCRRGR
jgi:hypothetical protein